MKLLTIPILLITLMFSSTSYAKWTKVSENVKGNFYVDFDRINKVDGYVHWWELVNLFEEDEYGFVSVIRKKQGDCKLYRYKMLSIYIYKLPMGDGNSEMISPPGTWVFPPPETSGEVILKSVCDRVK